MTSTPGPTDDGQAADGEAPDCRRSGSNRSHSVVGVVAIDGPSGTGKSTVARKLARDLGVRYLDSGAMYRAATLAVLDAGVDPSDAEGVATLVRGLSIEIGTDPRRPDVRLNGRDVAAAIRSGDVTAAVSAVSAIPAVRELLVAQQRRIIARGDIVVEGRDIGTVVWPTAWPKVYLTAHAAERARRRASELGHQGDPVALSGVQADLRRRDEFDSSRPASPLARAADAVEIDTTRLDIEEVVQRLIVMSIKARAEPTS